MLPLAFPHCCSNVKSEKVNTALLWTGVCADSLWMKVLILKEYTMYFIEIWKFFLMVIVHHNLPQPSPTHLSQLKPPAVLHSDCIARWRTPTIGPPPSPSLYYCLVVVLGISQELKLKNIVFVRITDVFLVCCSWHYATCIQWQVDTCFHWCYTGYNMLSRHWSRLTSLLSQTNCTVYNYIVHFFHQEIKCDYCCCQVV